MEDPQHRRGFPAEWIERILPSEQFRDDREPPLRLGDVVQLNSGGPQSLIVDLVDCNTVVISWIDRQGHPCEAIFPSACVHRVRLVG